MDRTEDPMIRLEGISKRYADGTVAVHELDLEVGRGELTVLVGPSGCGKTTTMKMINRLIEPSSGRIFIDGEDVTATDPVQLRRRIGYVIQQIGLFPHQTIRANVATVPSLLGWDRAKLRSRTDELLELVGLEPEIHGGRYPHQLSGGQRQRVGVARALAADPPVLLMDEPFGAVDPIARDRLQLEFLRLQREVRKTIVFVTHDIEEAVRLGDRIAVFRTGGYLEQYDHPATILGNPASEFVAGFVGSDRGLKQLSVTPLEDSDLEHPPTVRLHDTLATAHQILRRDGARWAVVLDDDGSLKGWIGVDATHGQGEVADRVQRMEAWVRRSQSLKDAFAEMLQNDAGWVAVLADDTYVGVVTPNTLHEGLRRAIRADLHGVEPADVELDSVAHA